MEHYCPVHRSRYYKNEKVEPTGQLSIWYSHKKADGSGFCVEQNSEQKLPAQQSNGRLTLREVSDSATQKMFACNAMNNAIALACNGKISLEQIEPQYKKILSALGQAN